ncbi:hypothetical protein [Candidatus Borrarchaeum sp.]|uniref:hypothetical protein n=1 Tax=Candidatus Borrarchaeum sp. TaxID=2846742 RepID=UPI00257BCBEA|nr:hypothetical protein [Candidatus Borrarchaeum sp.]
MKKEKSIEKTLEDSFTNAFPDTTPPLEDDKNPKGIVVATPSSELNPRLAKTIAESNIPKLQGETLEEDEIITPEGEVYKIEKATHGLNYTKSERTAAFRKLMTAIAYGEEREVTIDGKKQKITIRRTDIFPGDLTPYAQYCENPECKELFIPEPEGKGKKIISRNALTVETMYDGTDIIVIKTCNRCDAQHITVSDMRATRFFMVSRS